MLCEFLTSQMYALTLPETYWYYLTKKQTGRNTNLKNLLFEGFDYEKVYSNVFQTPRFTHILLKRDCEHHIVIILSSRNGCRINFFFYSLYRDLHPHTEREREATPHTDENYLKIEMLNSTDCFFFAFSLQVCVSTH